MTWHQMALEQVCDLMTDGTHYTPPDIGGGVPFLTVKDMSNSGLDFENCSRISQSDFEVAKNGNSAPQVGDILFSKDGTVGKVHVVNEEQNFAVLSSIAILRPKHGILDSNYLGHALKAPITLQQTTRAKTGSALRRVILKDLCRVKILVPPLAEQRRIAAILDQADTLRRHRQAARTRLRDLIPSIFHDMFGDPGSIADEKRWPLVKIGDICQVKGGKRLPKGEDYADNPTLFRYIRVCDIHNGWVNESDLRFLKASTQRRISRYIVSDGDLIITIAGTIGAVASVGRTLDGVNLTENAAKLVPKFKDKYNVQFLSEIIRTPFVRNQISQRTGQVTIGKLALFRIEQILLPFPPMGEQKEFAARVARIRALEAAYTTSQRHADTLFQSLLHHVFVGAL